MSDANVLLQKDLFDAIERGEYPKWKCYVQTMTPKQAEEFKYNVFDLTKSESVNKPHMFRARLNQSLSFLAWPQKEFPKREFGEIVLDRNVKNYFSEVELAAFNPAHLIAGIEPSADPVLQSRLFSYPDTHRHRIGANYQQLPVNQHRNFEGMNFQRDGQMAFYNQGNQPTYISSIKPVNFKKNPVSLDQVHNQYIGWSLSFGISLLAFAHPLFLSQATPSPTCLRSSRSTSSSPGTFGPASSTTVPRNASSATFPDTCPTVARRTSLHASLPSSTRCRLIVPLASARPPVCPTTTRASLA